MTSILARYKSTGLILVGICLDQSLHRNIWKTDCIRSWTKEKKKSVWSICLCEWPGTDKENYQTIFPQIKAVEKTQER